MTLPRILTWRVVLPFAALGAVACVLCSAAPAQASVGLSVESVADPTHFAPADKAECEDEQGDNASCDRYGIAVLNTGDTASSATVTVRDRLPSGITTLGSRAPGRTVESEVGLHEGEKWSCVEPAAKLSEVKCTFASSIAPGAYTPAIKIPVTAPAEGVAQGTLLTNDVTVEGGETASAPRASASEQTEVSSQPPAFGITRFSLASAQRGRERILAPRGCIPALSSPVSNSPRSSRSGCRGIWKMRQFGRRTVKNVVVELPVGFAGDPLAVPRCPTVRVG